MEGCELWGNAAGGVQVQDEGDIFLMSCSLHDHTAGKAAGVYVDASAGGLVTVGADCVFARNVRGDIVRQTEEEAAAEE